jgi:hypothetical protein
METRVIKEVKGVEVKMEQNAQKMEVKIERLNAILAYGGSVVLALIIAVLFTVLPESSTLLR